MADLRLRPVRGRYTTSTDLTQGQVVSRLRLDHAQSQPLAVGKGAVEWITGLERLQKREDGFLGSVQGTNELI